MVTLEQKLNLFKKLVDEKVQKEIDEIIFSKDEEIKEYLDKEKKLLEANANRTKKVAFERIRRQKSEILSTLIQQERKQYLKKNEDLLKNLLFNLENKLREYMSTDDYSKHIEKSLKNSITTFSKDEKVYILIAPISYNNTKASIEKTLDELGYNDYKILETELSYIGGFIIENESQTIRLNKTFAEAIYLKREDLGQLLHDSIKRGDAI